MIKVIEYIFKEGVCVKWLNCSIEAVVYNILSASESLEILAAET